MFESKLNDVSKIDPWKKDGNNEFDYICLKQNSNIVFVCSMYYKLNKNVYPLNNQYIW